MTKAILVVDDETRPLNDLAEALQTHGYSITVIHGHADAVACFRESGPELIFVHLGLPTAVAVCEGVRDLPEGAIVPILFIGSGDPGRQDEINSASEALAKGGDFFFDQPLNLNRVMAKVQTYVGLARPLPTLPSAREAGRIASLAEPLTNSLQASGPGVPEEVGALPDFEWNTPAGASAAAPHLGRAADDLLAAIDSDDGDGPPATAIDPADSVDLDREPPSSGKGAPAAAMQDNVTSIAAVSAVDDAPARPEFDGEALPTEAGAGPQSTARPDSGGGLDEAALFDEPSLAPSSPAAISSLPSVFGASASEERMTTVSTPVVTEPQGQTVTEGLRAELDQQKRLALQQTESYAAKLAAERREVREAESARRVAERELEVQRQATDEKEAGAKLELERETERLRAELQRRQTTTAAEQAAAIVEQERTAAELRTTLEREYKERLAEQRRRTEAEQQAAQEEAERATTAAAAEAETRAENERQRLVQELEGRLETEAAAKAKLEAEVVEEREQFNARLKRREEAEQAAKESAVEERKKLLEEHAAREREDAEVRAQAAADADVEKAQLTEELAKERRRGVRQRASEDEARRPAETGRPSTDVVDLQASISAEPPTKTDAPENPAQENPGLGHPGDSPEDIGESGETEEANGRTIEPQPVAGALAEPPAVVIADGAADGFHEHFDVALWVGALASERATCRVDFESGKRRVRLYFEGGAPVAADSNQIFDRMEEYLYREGKITRAQYNDVRMKRLRGSRRIGAYLVTESALKPQELFAAVRGHLEEIFCGLFELQQGRALREESIEGLHEDDRVKLETSTEALILEGVRRKYLLARLIDRIGAPSTLVAPTHRGKNSGVGVDGAGLGLHGEEARIVRMVDGTRSIEDMVFSTGLAAENVYVILHTLIALGRAHVAVRGIEGLNADGSSAVDHIDAERIREKLEQVSRHDYFQILGVTDDATPYEIDRAFERCEREFDRSRFSEAIRRQFHGQLLEIGRVLEDAREVLRDESVRDAYARNLPA